ncbi:MAG: hypothetical protein P1Q69_04370 [Candidatus Thorarchaeota archaeon]|nr:hypothetical protein [Candidatus Thorarchaeota archaeon]
MSIEVTDDMLTLLLVIETYTKSSDSSHLDWLKELPLMSIIYEGAVKGIFKGYDYAPWSVSMLDGTRHWLNISREGKDDLEDLLDLRYISMLRLSTSQYGYLTAYRLTNRGGKIAQDVDPKLREKVRRFLYCKCGELRMAVVRGRKFFFECKSCGFESPIGIDIIEDVSYKTRVYLPDYLRNGNNGRDTE